MWLALTFSLRFNSASGGRGLASFQMACVGPGNFGLAFDLCHLVSIPRLCWFIFFPCENTKAFFAFCAPQNPNLNSLLCSSREPALTWHSRMIQRAEFWLRVISLLVPPSTPFPFYEHSCLSIYITVLGQFSLFVVVVVAVCLLWWLYKYSNQSLKPKYHPSGAEEYFSKEGGLDFPPIAF